MKRGGERDNMGSKSKHQSVEERREAASGRGALDSPDESQGDHSMEVFPSRMEGGEGGGRWEGGSRLVHRTKSLHIKEEEQQRPFSRFKFA